MRAGTQSISQCKVAQDSRRRIGGRDHQQQQELTNVCGAAAASSSWSSCGRYFHGLDQQHVVRHHRRIGVPVHSHRAQCEATPASAFKHVRVVQFSELWLFSMLSSMILSVVYTFRMQLRNIDFSVFSFCVFNDCLFNEFR